MVWQRMRFALLAGALAAVVAQPARACEGCHHSAPACGCAAACAQPCGGCEATPAPQQFCTIKVTECVPETYTATRTVYTTAWKDEKYTAYKCETVQEPRTRTVWDCVPTVEERTVMKSCVSYKQVTKMVSKWEDHGHYECREVPDHWASFKHKMKHRCHKSDCCEPCCEPCVPTKTKKVWVPCKVCVQCPVTCCEKVCTQVPEVCKVTVYKKVERTEKYTVCVTRQVAYEATRKVAVCVPKEEKYTCTRMVSRVVEKKVPVATCGSPCDSCEAAPCSSCKGHKVHFSLKRHHHKASCCD